MKVIEKAWLDAITQLGCIVCQVEGHGFSPAEPHHLLSGGRRRGHLFTIPLCPPHHRFGMNDKMATSRDQSRRRFEKRYGTEESLLAKSRSLVKKRFGLEFCNALGDRWIPVTERLPDDDLTVMISCTDADEPVWLGYHDEHGWHSATDSEPLGKMVTAWKPMPEPHHG